jgi:hypothetical protein
MLTQAHIRNKAIILITKPVRLEAGRTYGVWECESCGQAFLSVVDDRGDEQYVTRCACPTGTSE